MDPELSTATRMLGGTVLFRGSRGSYVFGWIAAEAHIETSSINVNNKYFSSFINPPIA
jgi:hypothetical protein